MADQLPLPHIGLAEEPGRKRPAKAERLFVGVFIAPDEANKITPVGEALRREHQIAERLIAADRYHISLEHLGDYRRIKSPIVYAAGKAGSRVSFAEFEVTFNRAGSFNTPPPKVGPHKRPFVLLAEPGLVSELRGNLAAELAKYNIRSSSHFVPHLTLTYSQKFVPFRDIEPITITVNQFALVHSRRGLTEYIFFERWMLNAA